MVFSYKKSKIDKNKTNPLPDKKIRCPKMSIGLGSLDGHSRLVLRT